ncbi:MAG: hypothetical protein JXA52_00195, partial [Planctomycetes bacterium]|nr:hypothetical protein [Planctomycetota bacterium]
TLKLWWTQFVRNISDLDLESTLHNVLRLKSFEYEGPEELLSIELPGDWIVRNEVSQETKLRELEKLVAREIGIDILFEKQTIERDVIVASGIYKFHQPTEVYTAEQYNNRIHLYVDETEPHEGGGGGIVDSVNDFLLMLGNLVNMPIEDRTELVKEIRIMYDHHSSSYLRSLEDDGEKAQKLNLLLGNLTKQTELQFRIERKPVEIWLVTLKDPGGEELPKADAMQGAENGFGPVIERVVNDDGAGVDFFVDLDKNLDFTPPAGLGRAGEEAAAFEWIAENGIDVSGETAQGFRGLVGINMIATPFPGERWETVTPEQILQDEAIAHGTPGTPAVMSAKGELPETFLFKTREGGVGILQITGFIDQVPRGVKIRYKLVRQGDQQAAAPNAADEYRQAIAGYENLSEEDKDFIRDKQTELVAMPFLQRVKPLMDALHRAGACQECDWGFKWDWGESGEAIGENSKVLAPMRDLANLALFRAEYLLNLSANPEEPQAKRTSAANAGIKDLVATMAMARNLGRKNLMVFHLVEIAIENLAIDQAALLSSKLNEGMRKDLRDKILALPKPTTFDEVITAEDQFADLEFARLVKQNPGIDNPHVREQLLVMRRPAIDIAKEENEKITELRALLLQGLEKEGDDETKGFTLTSEKTYKGENIKLEFGDGSDRNTEIF